MSKIKATVSDSASDMSDRDIALYLDGVEREGRSYDTATDGLSFKPPSRLSIGRHRVGILCNDGNGAYTDEKWSFKVKRRRP